MSAAAGESATALVAADLELRYRKRFHADVPAIRSLSLTLPAGVVTGLIGPNGAGKTTLIEILVGALTPTRGSVTWFGRDRWDERTRRRIGFCPDVPEVPGTLTARQAFFFFGRLHRMSAPLIASRLDELFDRLDLVGVVDRRVADLSRGTLVRLALAQALLHEPDLIVLDESFGPLDPIVQVELRSLIREHAASGASVLVSSHQLDQVGRTADIIMLMDRGELRGVLPGGTTDAEALERALLAAARSREQREEQ